MLKIKKIAVTGGLSAGKTTVCQFFKNLGAYVVSADEIVHRLLSPETPLGKQVVALLGETQLDRKKIAARVFSNPQQLAALEALLHPAVFEEIDKTYEEINRSKQYPLFVAEVPLLYETKQESRFDAVIAVVAKKSHGSRKEEFTLRMNRQLPADLKAKRADYVLYNNGSLAELEAQVKTLYPQLI